MRRALGVLPGEQGHRAFEELLAVNLDSLYRTALRLCDGRSADAEDLLQDSMLRAFDGRAELRDIAAGRAWLFRILVRTNFNRLRTRKRHPEHAVSDLSESEFEQALGEWSSQTRADDWLERLHEREIVRRALGSLEQNLRTVIVLTDVEGFTQREVAGMLDIPEGTVASRLFRARRALRDLLNPAAQAERRSV